MLVWGDFMEYMSSIFTTVFLLAGLVSIFWGAYIIRLNRKREANRAFLALCISLSVWSFGFAFANASQSLETALFWRRFSAVGWATIFSIILHFLLLLTNQNQAKREGNLEYHLFLLYIPAIICLYIFAFSNHMTAIQYNLVKVNSGWTNVAVNNGWDYFFYAYYGLYMILGLAVIWRWKKRLKDKIKIRQANVIFVAILVAAVLGSFVDITLSSFSGNLTPQMAPLFILIPTGAMYYLARHYDFIHKEKSYKEELIITENEKKKMFYIIAGAFVLSGFFNMIFEYNGLIKNDQHNINFGIFKSIMFIIVGIAIYIVQNIKNNSLKETITIIILVTNIPIIIMPFIDYASITVWVFPLIIIIASLVLSNKKLLISTAIVSIITQRLIWIFKPEVIVVVNQYDYILRMIIFITALAAGYLVNEMYVAKIKQNDFQLMFQKLNAEISSDFITISQENLDEKINELLCKIGLFFEVDRTYLFLINYEDNTMTYSHEWCNDGIDTEVGTIESIPLSTFPWWIDNLKNNQLVYIEDTSKMPKEAINEQDQLIRQNVKSLISVPVEGENRMKAFVGIDSVKHYRKWASQDTKLLTILSNLLSDALARVKSEKEIEYMAYYDRLTDLPNRFLFKDRVKKGISVSKKVGTWLNIIFIDLDDFKSVNDTIGHEGGDYLLREVANRLKSNVRKTDTVARFGGDEFMIMLKNIDNQNDVPKIVGHIMDVFIKPYNIYGQDFFITGSAGISAFPVDGEDPETLIKNADIAMYEAKSKGKNTYAMCTPKMKSEVSKNITMSNDLHYALEREELFIHYQPQMDLNTKEITGLEALLRWKHPKFGMISPKVFIPIAEEKGLISSIGEWVLKTACLQNKRWQDMGLANLKMGVNLSVMQFINPDISNQVETILKETGLDPKYLEIEITESIAIKETGFVAEVLKKLKKIGISIAIDDFGTEYSSLSRLKMLPIDRIKIDMEFIHGIENNEKDQAITVIIINLAKSLGLNVLAEGVETASQSDFLNQKMCDYVQGYYHYKPMPADEIESLLKTLDMQ